MEQEFDAASNLSQIVEILIYVQSSFGAQS